MLARFLAFALLVAASAVAAVEPSPGVLAVATYAGADRMERLVEGARREGELMLYSSLTQEDQLRLAAEFKRRYGVTLKFWRGSQAHIVQRVMSEARAGRNEFDVLETNAPQIEAIAREKLLQRIDSPLLADELIAATLPPHGEWAPDRLNLMVYAYNTDLVKKPDLPATWDALAGAKWKGRVGMESTNVEWFAAVVDSMGEKAGLELFRRLGDNGVAVRTGHTHSTGRVIAGEIPMMLGVYSHDVDRMKAKGAPVDWFLLPPAIVLPSAVAVSRRAAHPNAAVLFFEFMLGDGQRLFAGEHRIPANRSYETPVKRLVQEGRPIRIVDSQQAIDEYEKWYQLYKRLIVDRSQR